MGDELIEVVGLENSILITDIWFIILLSDMGDKLIEVVGLENSMHVGKVYAGLRASAKRLSQCSSVVIR